MTTTTYSDGMYAFPKSEVADRLYVSVRTVEDLIRAGKLQSIRVGRNIRVTPAQLADFLIQDGAAA